MVLSRVLEMGHSMESLRGASWVPWFHLVLLEYE
jgi:hypothetical protein